MKQIKEQNPYKTKPLDAESQYLLECLDGNCNNCKHFVRDIERKKEWTEKNKVIALDSATDRRNRLIALSTKINKGTNDYLYDEKERANFIKQANKVEPIFYPENIIYGRCSKKDEDVTILSTLSVSLPCFEHRREYPI